MAKGLFLVQFLISDENLMSFKRLVRDPTDCAISALEILNIVDSINGGLMRIAANEQGLNKIQIQKIFSLVYPDYKWKFQKYTNFNTLLNIFINELRIGCVIFCGYGSIYEFGHVFLIGKTSDNEVVYIDPHCAGFCNIAKKGCFDYLKNQKEYYILLSNSKTDDVVPMQIDQVQISL